ncbi:MAG: DNA-3-methyladenine glycosylase family protein [Phycisphaerales bacterium]
MRLSLPTPRGYLFHRDFCSYGYFLLMPNRWDPARRTLTRPLNFEGGVATLTVAQPDGKSTPIRVVTDRALSRREQAQAKSQLRRMLSLDDEGVREFHRLDPRWKRSGRGRLMRSPTFFEDVVKTVTSCNVAWPSTIIMNRKLCEVFNPAFPTPMQLARARPAKLRARCSVGYRDKRLVELAKLAMSGELDAEWFENPATPDDELHAALIDLPGIGPYAAANIMQLLGRYHLLPLDSESVRHGRNVLGFQGNEKQVMKRVDAHFAPFGPHRFRSYWFELWDWYEAKRGKSWTWDPATTGKTFTASQF